MQGYVREMSESGYSPGRIDRFHKIGLPYLARRFFPNKDVTILDIGVGSGHCLLPLKKAGYNKLYK